MPGSVRFRSGNPRGFPMNAGLCGGPQREQKRLICSIISTGPEAKVLLAMQKVVGSNPISRSQKGLHLQAFFVEAAG